MNIFKAFTHKTPDGWQVFLRFAHNSTAKPLINKQKQPIIFKNALEAEKAVNHHLLAYMNGQYQRCGIHANNAIRQRAEQLFKPKQNDLRDLGVKHD